MEIQKTTLQEESQMPHIPEMPFDFIACFIRQSIGWSFEGIHCFVFRRLA
jgi:hypothetical protein